MGVDHGLSGRDGIKSKARREKKAKKNKVVAMRALTGGKKKEVIFDENARTEWLSGFHKRKQERRKYGLAMEILKKHKAHKELIKDQRNAFNEEKDKKTEDIMKIKDDESEEEEEEEVDPEADAALKYTASVTSSKNQEVSVFEDPSTVSMFGSTVSVVVDTSLGDNAGDSDNSDTEAVRGSRNSAGRSTNKRPTKSEPTRFEKAMKLAKVKMGKRKIKHKDNSIQGKASSLALKSKVDSSKLLSKVLRKPMKGKHTGGRRRK